MKTIKIPQTDDDYEKNIVNGTIVIDSAVSKLEYSIDTQKHKRIEIIHEMLRGFMEEQKTETKSIKRGSTIDYGITESIFYKILDKASQPIENEAQSDSEKSEI